MVFSAYELLSYANESEWLVPGDVIGMGTFPNGSGIEIDEDLKSGDKLELILRTPSSFLNEKKSKNQDLCALMNKIGEKETKEGFVYALPAEKQARKHKLPLVAGILILILSILLLFAFNPIEAKRNILKRKPRAPKFFYQLEQNPIFYMQTSSFDCWNDETFHACESLVFDKDSSDFYCSMRDGTIRLMNFATRSSKILARTGSVDVEDENMLPSLNSSFCRQEKVENQEICGVPLGLEMDWDTKTLYIADAYKGILTLNINTGKLQRILGKKELGSKVNIAIFNSLQKRGDTIFFSVSSTKFFLGFHFFIFSFQNLRIFLKIFHILQANCTKIQFLEQEVADCLNTTQKQKN